MSPPPNSAARAVVSWPMRVFFSVLRVHLWGVVRASFLLFSCAHYKKKGDSTVD